MIDLRKFKTMLTPHDVPEELEKLIEFQNASNQFYARGFEITCNDGNAILSTYSKDNKFQESFLGFANADGTGSEYMFWLQKNTQLSECPIVVFGSEGGVHAIASNFRELLKLLSSDIDPMIMWDRVIFYNDDDKQPSQRHDEYLEWLDKLNIPKETNIDSILEHAKSQYQQQLTDLISSVT